LNVAGSKHPFQLYRAEGIPVSLNTDDEGVNRSNLTNEFLRAVRTYHLSYRDLKTLVRNSLEHSFLPGESLYVDGNVARLRPGCLSVREPGWKPDARTQERIGASEKLSLELRLERAFVAFEN
jgi:hypothetical protein